MIVLTDTPVEITEGLILAELRADFKIPKASAEKRWGKEIAELADKSKAWITPAGIYEIFNCETAGNQLILDDGKAILTSYSLAKAIGGSKKIGLFVATIGGELEKRIKKISYPEDIILEAIGSAATEACAEYMHRQIIEPLIKEKSCQKTVRLSPGWGSHKKKQNWDITEQKIIFDLLKPEVKPVDVALTANYLMMPRKSVSAIVGVKTQKAG